MQKVRITDVPIYGEIPAGMSVLAEQSAEGHVSLDTGSVNASKDGRTFALRVRGDSMIDAHILDGDIVILEDRKDAQNGDIVAALIDGETTLKRYVMDRGRPYLKAENPQFPDLLPARELRIQGVMVSLVRKQMTGCAERKAADECSVEHVRLPVAMFSAWHARSNIVELRQPACGGTRFRSRVIAPQARIATGVAAAR